MKDNLKKYLNAKRTIIWCNSSDYQEIDEVVESAIQDVEEKEIYEYRALGCVDFKTKELYDERVNLYSFLDTVWKEGYDKNVYLILKDVDKELENEVVISAIKRVAEVGYRENDLLL